MSRERKLGVYLLIAALTFGAGCGASDGTTGAAEMPAAVTTRWIMFRMTWESSMIKIFKSSPRVP